MATNPFKLPFVQSMRLSNSDRFSGTSTKAWYLFASPQDAAMIVAFLQGKQTPTVEFFDYGAALGDFRAAYKAKGEA